MTGNPSRWAGRTPGGLAEGALVASYRIEEQIGAGGMAVVYRAYDTRLRRQVALKVMSEAAAADAALTWAAGRGSMRSPRRTAGSCGGTRRPASVLPP